MVTERRPRCATNVGSHLQSGAPIKAFGFFANALAGWIEGGVGRRGPPAPEWVSRLAPSAPAAAQ